MPCKHCMLPEGEHTDAHEGSCVSYEAETHPCDHSHWDAAIHGRRCTCGALIAMRRFYHELEPYSCK